MKVPLTRGLFALVDEEDWVNISHYTWRAVPQNGGWIARTTLGHCLQATMQELIMGIRPGFEIDHRNRDTLDNRRENLRWATRPQNMANRALPNRTGFKGVFKHGKGFAACIKPPRGRTTYLGSFDTAEEAHQAYRLAALHLFGEFACFDCKPQKRKDET